MEYSTKIADSIADWLKRQDWSYSFDELHGVFLVEADLVCKLGSALIVTQVQKDSFIAYAALPVEVPDSARVQVAEYLHRANYGLPNGNFEFGWDEGDVQYKTYAGCPDEAPGDAQIEDSYMIPLTVIDRYGDGLLELIKDGGSAAKRIIDELERGQR